MIESQDFSISRYVLKLILYTNGDIFYREVDLLYKNCLLKRYKVFVEKRFKKK